MHIAAQMVNAKSDDIALVSSASYGIQIAANNLPLSDGGEILLIQDQFPSHVYPWREKAKTCAGKVTTIARPENGDWTSAVLGSIDPRTEIVALPATHWADGGYLDSEHYWRSRALGSTLNWCSI